MGPDSPGGSPVDDLESAYVPVTYDHCDHIEGPFFHGTREVFVPGDLLTAGHESNYHDGRISNNVYFSALMEPAIWGAELAVALADNDNDDAPGHIYVVEPTGPFEDDPNLTNKRFPGNVTRSYRTSPALSHLEDGSCRGVALPGCCGVVRGRRLHRAPRRCAVGYGCAGPPYSRPSRDREKRHGGSVMKVMVMKVMKVMKVVS